MTENISFVGEKQHKQRCRGAKQNKYFRSEAKKILLSSDNLYRSIMAHFITGMMSGAFLYMTFFIPELIEIYLKDQLTDQTVSALAFASRIVLMLCCTFFLFAFMLGTGMMCSGMRCDGNEDKEPSMSSLSVILTPLSTLSRARVTVVLYLILFSQLCAVAVPSYYVIKNAFVFCKSPAAVAAVITVISVSALFLILFFCMIFLPYPYVIRDHPGAGVLQIYGECASSALCGMYRGYRLLLSFLPMILLSLLSFFVLFFAYTLPYMTQSFCKCGEYLYNLSDPERRYYNEQT